MSPTTAADRTNFEITIEPINDLDLAVFAHPRWSAVAASMALADNAEDYGYGAADVARLNRAATRRYCRLRQTVKSVLTQVARPCPALRAQRRSSRPAKRASEGVRIVLDTSNRDAVITLAEALGASAADLWLDGKFDLD